MESKDIGTSSASKFLISIMLVAAIGAIFLSYFKYFVLQDFVLFVKEPCDPSSRICFVHECEEGDVRCELLSEKKMFYQIVEQRQNRVTTCDENSCTPIECSLNDTACVVHYCSEESLSEFELSDSCSS